MKIEITINNQQCQSFDANWVESFIKCNLDTLFCIKIKLTLPPSTLSSHFFTLDLKSHKFVEMEKIENLPINHNSLFETTMADAQLPQDWAIAGYEKRVETLREIHSCQSIQCLQLSCKCASIFLIYCNYSHFSHFFCCESSSWLVVIFLSYIYSFYCVVVTSTRWWIKYKSSE